MNELMSVIIPIYNVERYLERCLNSVINQSYRNLEIVLVDDGSTDKSGKICDDYAFKDDRIVVIHKENEGLVRARKSGLEIARGELIGFVDGDDYIDSDMYSSLKNNMDKIQADIVSSGYIIDGRGIFNNRSNLYEVSANNRASLITERINCADDAIIASLCVKLFRKDIIKKTYVMVPDSQSYGEDYICFLACLLFSGKISVMNKAFYHYTVREDSISHRSFPDMIMNEASLCGTMNRLLMAEYRGENFNETIDNRLCKFLLTEISHLKHKTDDCFNNQLYSFPKVEMLKNHKIALYGAGKVGQDYYIQISRYNNCHIVLWVDMNWENYEFDYCEVVNPKELLSEAYDYVIVAINQKSVADEIKGALICEGISENKIIWEKPKHNF